MDTGKVFVAPLSILTDNKSSVLSSGLIDIIDIRFSSKIFRLALVYKKSKIKYLDIVTSEIYKQGVSLKSRVGDIVINPAIFKVPLSEIESTKRHLPRKEIIDRFNNNEFYEKAKQKILSYEYFD